MVSPPMTAERAIELARSGEPAAMATVMHVLTTTNDHALRNACAIALGDVHAEELVAVVGRLLRDPRTENHRGSLIYALEESDVRPILATLVEVALSSEYEASGEAMTRMGSLGDGLADEVRKNCAALVERALASTDLSGRQRENAEYLASLFQLERL